MACCIGYDSEYDPLEPNRRAVTAKVGRLRDPCSRVLDKRAEENGLLGDKGEGARMDIYLSSEVGTKSVLFPKSLLPWPTDAKSGSGLQYIMFALECPVAL